ncbi:glycosyltransferase [Aquibium microcysteis]|uniref:glycosyltransferase n=1 Tax=Aquibium microcysteis TaxID=675281 RepID=UPI00165CF19C|nr:glycosyltransferase [Aquibium microcysteis]
MAFHHVLKHAFRKHVRGDYPYAADAPDDVSQRMIWACPVRSSSDLLVYTAHNPMAPLGAAQLVGRYLAGRRVLFLLKLTWSARAPHIVRRLASIVDIYRHRRPEHDFLVLCNEPEEVALMSRAGLKTVFFNHNALVDEFVFREGSHQEKDFTAVYNGAMIPWKRHALAALVDRCAFIYYRNNDVTAEEAIRYLLSLKALMPRHAFINEVRDGEIVAISRQRVMEILTRSRVGLCLSAVEGAMYASIEYLLCGLPVVSTDSLGGRDQFADEAYWLTVDDTREAVRDGVAEMAGRAFPDGLIRERTLTKMLSFRSTLRDAVAEVTDGRIAMPDDLHDVAYRPPRAYLSGPQLRQVLAEGE